MTKQEFLDQISAVLNRIGWSATRLGESLVDAFQAVPANAWSAIAAIATAAAAIFAARSAGISRKSAQAAEDAVHEARLARLEERAPRLVLEKDFLDFKVVGPSPHNEQPIYEAREDHTTGYRQTRATFSLTNHGGGPGLELLIVFDLDDPNGELMVPEGMETLGSVQLSTIEEINATPDGLTVKCLQMTQDATGCGLPMYRRWSIDLPNSAPGQTRKVELPTALLARLLLRGLQYRARGGSMDSLEHIIMTIKISCHTIDGSPYETQFRFKLFPFWQGEVNPLRVSSHIQEMPMYPKPKESRAA